MQATKMFKSSKERASAHVNTKEGSIMTRPNTRRGRGLASLAIFAVLASLLVVGATPAAAVDEDSEPDYAAEADACVGAAQEARDFADVSADHTFYDAINCLAHYGITVGCGDGTIFCPSRTVNRWQMALFLHRASGLAGIDLGDPEDQGFTDISDMPIGWQRAINDLSNVGIIPGVSSTEFDPTGDVPRKDMAVFLANFIDQASDVVTLEEDGTYRLGAAEEEPNDRFCDSYLSTPRHVDSAISVIYELGVTVGRSDATTGPCAGERIFDPEGLVSRGQMAAFITRALGHTNARPAGLSAQSVGGDVTVSIRDAMNAPVVNVLVDAFYVSADDEDRAFDSGECSRRVVAIDGLEACEIDFGDQPTLTDGNVELSQISSDVIGEEGVVVWVWAGRDGDEFDEMATSYYKLTITSDEIELPMPDSAEVTSDLPDDVTHARYGSRVTYTIQLQGEMPNGQSVDVPREKGEDGEISYSLAVATYRNPSDLEGSNNGIDADDLGAAGNASTLWRRTTDEVEIARDGSATFTITASDPDTMAASDDTSYVQWTLTPATGDPVPDPSSNIVAFSDAAGTVSNVEVTTSEFVLAPRDARDNASNTVTITVTDQYGNPIRGASVTLSSADATSTVPERARVTNRNGAVRIGYRYSGSAGVEMLRASWDGHRAARDLNNDGDMDDEGEAAVGMDGVAGADADCQIEDVCGDASVYWAEIWESDINGPASVDTSDQSAEYAVLNADVGDNEIVADSGTGDAVEPVVVYYDSNDYFDVDDENDAMSMGMEPVNMDGFEEALADALEAYEEAVEAAEASSVGTGDDIGRPTITWSSYESDDKSDIARFSLMVPVYS